MKTYRFMHCLGVTDDKKSLFSDRFGHQWWKRTKPAKIWNCILCNEPIEKGEMCWRPDVGVANKSHKICCECMFVMEMTDVGENPIEVGSLRITVVPGRRSQ